MASVSKLKVIRTLDLENDSSKGKVLQNVASFLKVMEKKNLKKKKKKAKKKCCSELHKIGQKLKMSRIFVC